MSTSIDDARLLDLGRQALRIEADAVAALIARLGADFVRACRMCLACRGRVVVTGMGKSGHIGGKIASTLASTGTPAFFLHPGEASHGDFGMITRDDVALPISNSGETGEILTLLPLLKRMGLQKPSYSRRSACSRNPRRASCRPATRSSARCWSESLPGASSAWTSRGMRSPRAGSTATSTPSRASGRTASICWWAT